MDAKERLRARRNQERMQRYAARTTAPMAPVVCVADDSSVVDSGSLGWFVFGMLVPPLGLVTWMLNRHESPKSCKRILKGILAGIIVIGLCAAAAFYGMGAAHSIRLDEMLGSPKLEFGMPTLSGGSGAESELHITPADEYETTMV